MAVTKSINRTPEWLRPLWESKSAETAARISAGMEMLLKQNQPVTLAGVQQAILAQSNVRISPSTIQRSQTYRRHRRSATPPSLIFGIDRCAERSWTTRPEESFSKGLPIASR